MEPLEIEEAELTFEHELHDVHLYADGDYVGSATRTWKGVRPISYIA